MSLRRISIWASYYPFDVLFGKNWLNALTGAECFFKTWHKTGINTINKLLDEDNFVTSSTPKPIFLCYNTVIEGIPATWRKGITTSTEERYISKENLSPEIGTVRTVRSLLVEYSSSPSAADETLNILG